MSGTTAAHDDASLQQQAGDAGLATSRLNIPAVCRIPGRGTGFLVSPGLILTSTRVVGTKHEAARLTAVFFEGGKRPRVEVALLPNQFFFAAGYPEHLDYCLVACETTKIFNVTPVKLPLVSSEWSPVREGDMLFTIEHPVTTGSAANIRQGAAAAAAATNADGTPASGVGSAAMAVAVADEQTPATVRRFVEVLRRKDDRMYTKPHGNHVSAGCPVFNDGGSLVGLMAQAHDPDTDALTCVIVSIVTAVKHIFANGRISKIQQEPLFSDVWATWNVSGDTARIVAILANFTQKSIHKDVSLRFFQHCHEREHVAGIVAAGGTGVILDSLRRHRGDASFAHEGLRALWAISFDVEDNRAQITMADGVRVILECMADYPDHDGIIQYATVLLYNVTLTKSTVSDDWAAEGIDRVFVGATQFADSEVTQKFAIGFMMNMVGADVKHSEKLLNDGIVRHCMDMMTRYASNEYLNDHGVRLVSSIVQSPRFHGIPALSVCVDPVVNAIVRFDGANALRVEGSHALWGLGNDPRNRIAIFNNPRGVEALQLSVGVVSAKRTIEMA